VSTLVRQSSQKEEKVVGNLEQMVTPLGIVPREWRVSTRLCDEHMTDFLALPLVAKPTVRTHVA